MTDVIVTGLFTISGVLIGFWLHYRFEKQKNNEEFEEIKNSIFYCLITNYLGVELYKFKKFFFRHDYLLKLPENEKFFKEYLISMTELNNQPMVNTMWDKDKLEKMYDDLSKTSYKRRWSEWIC